MSGVYRWNEDFVVCVFFIFKLKLIVLELTLQKIVLFFFFAQFVFQHKDLLNILESARPVLNTVFDLI